MVGDLKVAGWALVGLLVLAWAYKTAFHKQVVI